MAISGIDHLTSDKTTTTATRISARPDLWTVSDRPGLYTRNQATTAMVVAEMKARPLPCPNDAVVIAAHEQELLVPPMPVDPWALLQAMRDAARAASSLTETPEFFDMPFGGDLAEVNARAAETAADLAGLADRCAVLSGGMAEPGLGWTSTAVAWDRAASAALTAGELLSKAAELLKTAHRAAEEAQRLGRIERAGG